jgi:predicted amidohydrolase YtcJ
VLPVELDPAVRAFGVTVVTQPNFVAERGHEYANEVDADDLDVLYRCGTLFEAGIAVAGSTDAPFGIADPWRAMRAAVERRAEGGAVLGGHETIDARVALGMFLGDLHMPGGPPRAVAAGAPADLCLLHTPLRDALDALDASLVALTTACGRIVYDGFRS